MIKKKNELNELNELVKDSPSFKRFYKLIEDINTIPTKDWTATHSLAYIILKYKQKFNKEYVLSFDTAISKCYEYKLCTRMWAMLSAKACEGEKVKLFIDWYYDKYNTKQFRSVGALIKIEVICLYLEYLKKPVSINSEIPSNIIEIIKTIEEFSYIKTFGDLFYIKKAYDENPSEHFENLFSILKNNGFDISILDRLG